MYQTLLHIAGNNAICLCAEEKDVRFAEVVAKDVKSCREKIFAAVEYAAKFHGLVERCDDMDDVKKSEMPTWIWVQKIRERLEAQNGKVCVQVSKEYLYMRCGTSQQVWSFGSSVQGYAWLGQGYHA